MRKEEGEEEDEIPSGVEEPGASPGKLVELKHDEDEDEDDMIVDVC